MNPSDLKTLMAALPQPMPEIHEVGYCAERRQTFIALKAPALRLVLVVSGLKSALKHSKTQTKQQVVRYLRIDEVGGSPDIYFTQYNEAAKHEFYLPTQPEMAIPHYSATSSPSCAVDPGLTDEQVALLTQWAHYLK
jgi:hypothetical protein